jgi:hypothetical protein
LSQPPNLSHCVSGTSTAVRHTDVAVIQTLQSDDFSIINHNYRPPNIILAFSICLYILYRGALLLGIPCSEFSDRLLYFTGKDALFNWNTHDIKIVEQMGLLERIRKNK